MDNTLTWDKKQDEFCLKCKISGCAKLLLQWLCRHHPKDCEPDLKSFNSWAAKHRGKPYHRDTLKQAFKKLVNTGVVVVERFFKWNVSRIELVFLWARKKSRNRDRDRGSDPSKPSIASSFALQQQPVLTEDQEAIAQQLKIAGIQFEDYSPLWKFSEEEIDRAIKYYLQYPNTETIRNPAGWVIKCLQKQWYKSTFIDTPKATNPHLIAVAWENVKGYVKEVVGVVGIEANTEIPTENLPPPSPSGFQNFLSDLVAIKSGEKSTFKQP